MNASFSKNKFFVNGAFTRNDFRGYGGNYGRDKSWKPKEQWLGNATIGYRGEKNTIYYRIDGLDENIAAKGAINMNTYKAFDQQFITSRWMHQVQDDWHINQKFHLNSAISYTDYSRRTHSTRHDFTNNTDELTTGLGEQDTAVFTTLFFRSQGHYKINEKLSVQPGVEYNRNAASGARIEGSPVINDFAFFASAEWRPLTRVNIRPGFRLIKNSLYDAPPIVPALNAKIGLRDNIDLRLAYAQGYRAPALRELYFDFVDANHKIYGNKDLEAETSNSINAALSWRYGTQLRSTFTFSSFYNVFKNLIDYGTDQTDGTITRMMNIDEFKTTGASFEQMFVYRQWQLNIGALYIGRYNRLSSEDNVSREVPKFNWSPEANASLYYNWKKAETTLAFMYKYTGPRPTWQYVSITTSNEVKLTQLSSFSWADFTATKTLLKNITLQTGIKNIFDIKNVNNTSAGDGVHSGGGGASPIGYGRSYFLGISYQFIKNK
ncbi:TonB-dependent receptor plug domain-containing protein [Niabella hibiscisoli]|uniref:TonB-dependent receptor plug domain-containing protein n=1 Tax=Niabella hibiscisoli TaxID=1825928 RepID=UPI001F1125FA|nr:TonB-dependent receptor [Niabella hibiscisoli]MCH5715153.1 TonB-dependent receptor [Niabella hibiscisoli]